MRENNSTKWSIGVKFIQLRKNHAFLSANKFSPYKAIFGIDTSMGLQSLDIPREAWSKLDTTNDLFRICGIENEYDDCFKAVNENEDVDVDNDVFNSSEYGVQNEISQANTQQV